MAFPPLRYVDATPIEHEGQPAILVRDPTGLVEDPIVLSPIAFFIATLLNGENDVLDIQYATASQCNGLIITEEQIREVVGFLDEQGFLLSERYAAMAREVAEAFNRCDTRPAYLAGKSYPDEPAELRSYLDAVLKEDGGGGRPEGSAAPVRCLVAPHIDFERGRPAYASAYGRLARSRRPETVLLFGVAHAAAPVPFVLTRKHYATPLGVLKTDIEAVDRLAAACSWDPFEYEIAHRTEHSIEFQAVMLAHLFGTDVTLVPVLCGAFDEDPDAVPDPETLGGVQAFLAACREHVRQAPTRTLVLAGVDLAHVGPRFGDDVPVDDALIQRVRERDRQDLERALAVDPAGWYRSVMSDGNERRVCGLNAVYAALQAVNGTAQPGGLLHYGYAHDPGGGIVSFAGIAYPAC